VPEILPSGYTIILDPACRGTEPRVAAMVARTQDIPSRRAETSSSKIDWLTVAERSKGGVWRPIFRL